MTLPSMTWRIAANYSFSTVTIPGVLAALNSMFAAETALGGYWGVSDYNAGNNTLELKRNGTQTGVRQTCRILLFGNSSPNAGALGNGVTAQASTLYAGLCEDANTTGPSQSFTVGNPYNVATKYTGAGAVYVASGVLAANNAFVTMAECDAGVIIVISDNTNTFYIFAGALAEKIKTTTETWIIGGNGLTAVNAASYLGTIAGIFPVQNTTATWALLSFLFYHNGSSKRALHTKVPANPGTVADYCADYPDWSLEPIIVYETAQTILSPVQFGVLRQIKMGPFSATKTAWYDGAGTLQSYAFTSGWMTTRAGIHLDVQP